MTTPTPGPEWDEDAHKAQQLAEGRCPWTGYILHMGGEAGPDSASCDMCDCFGFDPTKVKVHPTPLEVKRWKVTRKRCLQCSKPFAATIYETVCLPCVKKTTGLLSELSTWDFW